MGGSVAVHAAARKVIRNLASLVVIDLFKGSRDWNLGVGSLGFKGIKVGVWGFKGLGSGLGFEVTPAVLLLKKLRDTGKAATGNAHSVKQTKLNYYTAKVVAFLWASVQLINYELICLSIQVFSESSQESWSSCNCKILANLMLQKGQHIKHDFALYLCMQKTSLEAAIKGQKSMQGVIEWSVKGGPLRNIESARVSVPSTLVYDDSKKWYVGLSEMFLSCPVPKLLQLDGTDRQGNETYDINGAFDKLWKGNETSDSSGAFDKLWKVNIVLIDACCTIIILMLE
ncbi:hypothetical protein MUK42_01867 [Musa troglodytarum]|uniref:Uncharacterized protein n=1 Tax=Musa troglodytarum TaxID=320322 RepID=A0A9E7FHT9_9LILI|nr:hypothetical protein MUK42_01867 [Musa troglodytarum]